MGPLEIALISDPCLKIEGRMQQNPKTEQTTIKNQLVISLGQVLDGPWNPVNVWSPPSRATSGLVRNLVAAVVFATSSKPKAQLYPKWSCEAKFDIHKKNAAAGGGSQQWSLSRSAIKLKTKCL